jgi:hypothetical protein
VEGGEKTVATPIGGDNSTRGKYSLQLKLSYLPLTKIGICGKRTLQIAPDPPTPYNEHCSVIANAELLKWPLTATETQEDNDNQLWGTEIVNLV